MSELPEVAAYRENAARKSPEIVRTYADDAIKALEREVAKCESELRLLRKLHDHTYGWQFFGPYSGPYDEPEWVISELEAISRCKAELIAEHGGDDA